MFDASLDASSLSAYNSLLLGVSEIQAEGQPTAVRTHVWNEVSDMGLNGTISTRRIRLDDCKADQIDAEMYWDINKCCAELGYMLNDVLP